MMPVVRRLRRVSAGAYDRHRRETARPVRDSFGVRAVRFAQVVHDQPDLPGRENPLAGRVAALEQFVMQLPATDDPASKAVASLMGRQLRKVETGECRFLKWVNHVV